MLVLFVGERSGWGGHLYSASNSCRRRSRSCRRFLWPLHTLWRCLAAASSSRSRCLLSRSAWAWATVLEAPDCAGAQPELAPHGFVFRCPLRSTCRGRRDEPENVVNMVDRWSATATATTVSGGGGGRVFWRQTVLVEELWMIRPD